MDLRTWIDRVGARAHPCGCHASYLGVKSYQDSSTTVVVKKIRITNMQNHGVARFRWWRFASRPWLRSAPCSRQHAATLRGVVPPEAEPLRLVQVRKLRSLRHAADGHTARACTACPDIQPFLLRSRVRAHAAPRNVVAVSAADALRRSLCYTLRRLPEWPAPGAEVRAGTLHAAGGVAPDAAPRALPVPR